MKDNFFGFAHYAPSFYYDSIHQHGFVVEAYYLDFDDEGNEINRRPVGFRKHWEDYSPRVSEFLEYHGRFDPDNYDTTSEYFMGLEDYVWVRP